MKLKTIVSTLSFLMMVVSGCATENLRTTASMTLRDGSVIKGTLLTDEITGVALFDDDLELPAKIVKSVEFTSTNRDAKVTLVNGDHLKLKVKTDSFKLDSSLGKLTVMSDNFRSISLSTRKVSTNGVAVADVEPGVWVSLACPGYCRGENDFNRQQSPIKTVRQTSRVPADAPPMELYARYDGDRLVASWVPTDWGRHNLNGLSAEAHNEDGVVTAEGISDLGNKVRFDIYDNGEKIKMSWGEFYDRGEGQLESVIWESVKVQRRRILN